MIKCPQFFPFGALSSFPGLRLPLAVTLLGGLAFYGCGDATEPPPTVASNYPSPDLGGGGC